MAKRSNYKKAKKGIYFSPRALILIITFIITLIVGAFYFAKNMYNYSSAACPTGTSYYMGECRPKEEITKIMNEVKKGNDDWGKTLDVTPYNAKRASDVYSGKATSDTRPKPTPTKTTPKKIPSPTKTTPKKILPPPVKTTTNTTGGNVGVVAKTGGGNVTTNTTSNVGIDAKAGGKVTTDTTEPCQNSNAKGFCIAVTNLVRQTIGNSIRRIFNKPLLPVLPSN